MADIIRVDVVEHIYNPQKDAKIKKKRLTPEEQREKDDKAKQKELQKASNHRKRIMKSGLVYASVAARKAIQMSTQVAGYVIENSYNRQMFQATLSGNTRRARVLQNQKIVDKARVNYVSNLSNMAATSVAAFAINPTLGVIQVSAYTGQLALELQQLYVQYSEALRQFMVNAQKEVYESEYRRGRLLTNTFQNRGVGR